MLKYLQQKIQRLERFIKHYPPPPLTTTSTLFLKTQQENPDENGSLYRNYLFKLFFNFCLGYLELIFDKVATADNNERERVFEGEHVSVACLLVMSAI